MPVICHTRRLLLPRGPTNSLFKPNSKQHGHSIVSCHVLMQYSAIPLHSRTCREAPSSAARRSPEWRAPARRARPPRHPGASSRCSSSWCQALGPPAVNELSRICKCFSETQYCVLFLVAVHFSHDIMRKGSPLIGIEKQETRRRVALRPIWAPCRETSLRACPSYPGASLTFPSRRHQACHFRKRAASAPAE